MGASNTDFAQPCCNSFCLFVELVLTLVFVCQGTINFE